MLKNSVTFPVVGVLVIMILSVATGAQTISTFAGGGPTNVPANLSALGTPWGVVQDKNANTYISDNLSNRIFMVNAKNVVTVLAGNIVPGYSGDCFNPSTCSVATSASLNSPEGLAIDGAGNVYFADTGNNIVRVIANPQGSGLTIEGSSINAGDIITIAGTGQPGYSTGSGPVLAQTAQLNQPGGVWLDQSGNVYIADTNNSVIEVINTQSSTITVEGVSIPPNEIATIAGNNAGMFGGDGGPARSASINHPLGVFVNSDGTLFYIADTINNRVRVVNNSASQVTVANVKIGAGDIMTVAGDGTEGFSGDGLAATLAELNHPSAIYVDASGNIFIADGDNLPPPQNTVTSNERIRQVATTGTISTFAGNGTQCTNPANCGDGGAATSAELWAPTGVFVNSLGDLLIADQNDDAIRQVATGTIRTVIGILLDTSYSGDVNTANGIPGIATAASLRRPAGVASDSVGNIYIADTLNNAIRKVNSSGIISTVAGDGIGCNTLTCGDGNPATSAQLSLPSEVAFDGAGNMYIADSADNAIRVVNNQSAAITFYTGLSTQITVQPGNIQAIVDRTGITCTTAPCGDAGPALSAELNQPEALFIDKSGNIYIADTNDNAIRVVNTTASAITVANVTIQPGNIGTVAGTIDPNSNGDCTSGTSACGDGNPAISAQLNLPAGVALDSSQNIYISDTGDNRVRIVNSGGTINPFAGTGAACQNNCGDGGPATAALLDAPQGLFIDYAGTVFIADASDFEIREVTGGTINAVVDEEQSRGYSGDGGSPLTAQLAVPFGVTGDPFGNLLISDVQEWRVRKVTRTVTTAPFAALTPGNLNFRQAVDTTSPALNITVSNEGFGTTLLITNTGTLSGPNATDFKIVSNNCPSSLAAGATCAMSITFSPSTEGTFSAMLTVTDNAGGRSWRTAVSCTVRYRRFSSSIGAAGRLFR